MPSLGSPKGCTKGVDRRSLSVEGRDWKAVYRREPEKLCAASDVPPMALRFSYTLKRIRVGWLAPASPRL